MSSGSSRCAQRRDEENRLTGFWKGVYRQETPLNTGSPRSSAGVALEDTYTQIMVITWNIHRLIVPLRCKMNLLNKTISYIKSQKMFIAVSGNYSLLFIMVSFHVLVLASWNPLWCTRSKYFITCVTRVFWKLNGQSPSTRYPAETVFTFWMEEKSSISLITREHSRAAPT